MRSILVFAAHWALGHNPIQSKAWQVQRFIEAFSRYMNNGGDGLEAYGHLIERSNRVQVLGSSV